MKLPSQLHELWEIQAPRVYAAGSRKVVEASQKSSQFLDEYAEELKFCRVGSGMAADCLGDL